MKWNPAKSVQAIGPIFPFKKPKQESDESIGVSVQLT